MTEPTSSQPDYMLSLAGLFSAVELGDEDADIIDGPAAEYIYSLIENMTLLCRDLATHLAEGEGVDRLEIYRRLAAQFAEDDPAEG